MLSVIRIDFSSLFYVFSYYNLFFASITICFVFSILVAVYFSDNIFCFHYLSISIYFHSFFIVIQFLSSIVKDIIYIFFPFLFLLLGVLTILYRCILLAHLDAVVTSCHGMSHRVAQTRFPAINRVVEAINKKKSRDRLIIAFVIAGCILVALWMKGFL